MFPQDGGWDRDRFGPGPKLYDAYEAFNISSGRKKSGKEFTGWPTFFQDFLSGQWWRDIWNLLPVVCHCSERHLVLSILPTAGQSQGHIYGSGISEKDVKSPQYKDFMGRVDAKDLIVLSYYYLNKKPLFCLLVMHSLVEVSSTFKALVFTFSNFMENLNITQKWSFSFK